jgi:S-adenosylmethionine synthetase
MDYMFTSESVCAGHPDKICDGVSDAILDELLGQDPNSHVGVETMAGFKKLILAGEVKSKAKVDFEKIARHHIKKLGYTNPEWNFWDGVEIVNLIHQQSSEIAVGVDAQGAGDQGMMFGFACSDTKNYMPMAIEIAHELTKRMDEVRENAILPYLRPDGKSQVTVEYQNNKPVRVTKVVLAVPHDEKIKLEQVKKDLLKQVVLPVLKKYKFKISEKDLIVNGTGVWHIGGPASDSGLTGRKIIVDSYGGFARVGGGAFSGKDPTKVDRSGAYGARFLAKNIVAHGLAERAEVILAYFIGARQSLMQEVETFGMEKVSKKAINDFCVKLLDTSVWGIIERFKLQRPIYLATSAYGHFGRPEFPWEEIVEK